MKVSNIQVFTPNFYIINKNVNKSTYCLQSEQIEADREKLREAQKAYVGIEGVSFGYHHPLKTAFVKGRLPWLCVGFYGEKLTKKNVSIEHLQPVADFKKIYSDEKAKRLATTWENVVLASNRMNNLRGCEPLSSFIDYEAMGRYLAQFEGKYIPGFGTGEKYIRGILDTVNRLIQKETA